MSIKQILILSFALLCGQLNAQGIDPLELVPDRSRVLWTATKVTGEHTGGVPVASGTVEVADGELIGAEITMDMSGLTCLDIESPESNAKLVRHLKSDDFFAVEKFPAATFKTTKVEAIPGAGRGKPNYRVSGDLTIKGITHPVSFDCIFWMDGSSARAAANFTFDRSKYDIQYRSASFFSDLGDKAISDTVSLTFDIAAQ
jgi:polyisoprenoid-binding protein YceI